MNGFRGDGMDLRVEMERWKDGKSGQRGQI